MGRRATAGRGVNVGENMERESAFMLARQKSKSRTKLQAAMNPGSTMWCKIIPTNYTVPVYQVWNTPFYVNQTDRHARLPVGGTMTTNWHTSSGRDSYQTREI